MYTSQYTSQYVCVYMYASQHELVHTYQAIQGRQATLNLQPSYGRVLHILHHSPNALH